MAELFRIASAILPVIWWILIDLREPWFDSDTFYYFLSDWAIADHEESITLIEDSLSNIPSHPKQMKSCVFSSMVN